MKEALKQIVLSEENSPKRYSISYRGDCIGANSYAERFIEHFAALEVKNHYVIVHRVSSGASFVLDVRHELKEADLSAYTHAKKSALTKAMEIQIPLVDKTKHAKDKKEYNI